jgi:hypothetical protein
VAPEPTAPPEEAAPAVEAAPAAEEAAPETAVAPGIDPAAAQAQIQRRLRTAMGLLLGVWLILLGGLLWAGHRRRAQR